MRANPGSITLPPGRWRLPPAGQQVHALAPEALVKGFGAGVTQGRGAEPAQSGAQGATPG